MIFLISGGCGGSGGTGSTNSTSSTPGGPPVSPAGCAGSNPLTFTEVQWDTNGDGIKDTVCVGDENQNGSLDWSDIQTAIDNLCTGGACTNSHAGTILVPQGTWNSASIVTQGDCYSNDCDWIDFNYKNGRNYTNYTFQGAGIDITIIQSNQSKAYHDSMCNTYQASNNPGTGVAGINLSPAPQATSLNPGNIVISGFTFIGTKARYWENKDDCLGVGSSMTRRVTQTAINISPNSTAHAAPTGSTYSFSNIKIRNADYISIGIGQISNLTMNNIQCGDSNYPTTSAFGGSGLSLINIQNSTVNNFACYNGDSHHNTDGSCLDIETGQATGIQDTNGLTVNGVTIRNSQIGSNIIEQPNGNYNLNNVTITGFDFQQGATQICHDAGWWGGGWTQYSGNIYSTTTGLAKAPQTSAPLSVVKYGNTTLTYNASYGSLTSNQWGWDGTNLYVNVGGNPGTTTLISVTWTTGNGYGISLTENGGTGTGTTTNINISGTNLKDTSGPALAIGTARSTTNRNITFSGFSLSNNNYNSIDYGEIITAAYHGTGYLLSYFTINNTNANPYDVVHGSTTAATDVVYDHWTIGGTLGGVLNMWRLQSPATIQNGTFSDTNDGWNPTNDSGCSAPIIFQNNTISAANNNSSYGIGLAAANSIISGNTVIQNGGYGIQANGAGQQVTDNYVQGGQIYLGGNNILAGYNIVNTAPSKDGIYVGNNTGVVLNNNDVYNPDYASYNINNNVAMNNNVGWNAKNSNGDITIAASMTVTANNNWFRASGKNGSSGTYTSSTSDFSKADPQWINAGSNFGLQPGSPLINAGTNTAWSGVANVTSYNKVPITDASGNIVAPGGIVDIGAEEFNN